MVAALAGVFAAGLTLASANAARSTIRVPQDEPTIPEAIVRAKSGDTILVDRGTYRGGIVVSAAKHDLTIRGVDRTGVVLDGEDDRRNGISVYADGVSILNMSAHNFPADAFHWNGADRFRASYLTIWNVGRYGIYAEDGEQGTVDHDYVSGAADAAFYVGECSHCRATLSYLVAALSAVGYSGTNASEVTIRDSVWDRNGAGILPNTYANEEHPPQGGATIVRNKVTRSGRARVPISTPLAGFIGVGIAVAGGNENHIERNRVAGSERYGIAIFPTARRIAFTSSSQRDPGPPWRPRGNLVSRNVVSGSGTADLALARGVGARNWFVGNTVRTSLPRNVAVLRCASTGDTRVAAELTRGARAMFEEAMRRRDPPPYESMPVPPQQPSMSAGSR